MTKITKVRAEDWAPAGTKPALGLARSMSNVGRNSTLRSSASFFGGSSKTPGNLVDFLAASNAQASDGKTTCENNSDRLIHPKGVFIVDLGSEKLVLGAESSAERDLWIAALDACVKEAQADADDYDPVTDNDDDESKSSHPRRTQSLGGREMPAKVQISVSQNSATPAVPGSDELPSHLTWWANRGGGRTGPLSSTPPSASFPPPSSPVPISQRSSLPGNALNPLSKTPPSKSPPPPPLLASRSFNNGSSR